MPCPAVPCPALHHPQNHRSLGKVGDDKAFLTRLWATFGDGLRILAMRGEGRLSLASGVRNAMQEPLTNAVC